MQTLGVSDLGFVYQMSPDKRRSRRRCLDSRIIADALIEARRFVRAEAGRCWRITRRLVFGRFARDDKALVFHGGIYGKKGEPQIHSTRFLNCLLRPKAGRNESDASLRMTEWWR